MKSAYLGKAREDRRGPVVLEELPGADWSAEPILFFFWSAFQSPAPRRYTLPKAPAQRSSKRSSRSLRRTCSAPGRGRSRLWPLRQIQPGVKEEFTLYVRPTLGPT